MAKESKLVMFRIPQAWGPWRGEQAVEIEVSEDRDLKAKIGAGVIVSHDLVPIPDGDGDWMLSLLVEHEV